MKQNTTNPSQRFLVVKGKAGLGNRLLALAGANIYAAHTQRRLVVDWIRAGSEGQPENFFGKLFAPNALLDCPDNLAPFLIDPVFPEVWKDHSELSIDQIGKVLFPGDTEADEHRDFALKTSIRLGQDYPGKGTLFHWAWDASAPELYRFIPSLKQAKSDPIAASLNALLAPGEEIKGRIEDFVKSSFAPKMLGLHVRYSDKKLPFARTLQLAKQFQHKHPESGIYLATDNAELATLFSNELKRVVFAPKWFPAPGEAIHRADSNTNLLRSEKEAVTEMFLLSRCQSIIFDSRSTFGTCGAMLSKLGSENLTDLAQQSLKHRLRLLVKKALGKA